MAKEGGGFGSALFGLLFLVGVAWWVGLIWQAQGEARLLRACAPVQFLTDGIQKVARIATGAVPVWAINTQVNAVGGCYYAFKKILPDPQGAHQSFGLQGE